MFLLFFYMNCFPIYLLYSIIPCFLNQIQIYFSTDFDRFSFEFDYVLFIWMLYTNLGSNNFIVVFLRWLSITCLSSKSGSFWSSTTIFRIAFILFAYVVFVLLFWQSLANYYNSSLAWSDRSILPFSSQILTDSFLNNIAYYELPIKNFQSAAIWYFNAFLIEFGVKSYIYSFEIFTNRLIERHPTVFIIASYFNEGSSRTKFKSSSIYLFGTSSPFLILMLMMSPNNLNLSIFRAY